MGYQTKENPTDPPYKPYISIHHPFQCLVAGDGVTPDRAIPNPYIPAPPFSQPHRPKKKNKGNHHIITPPPPHILTTTLPGTPTTPTTPSSFSFSSPPTTPFSSAPTSPLSQAVDAVLCKLGCLFFSNRCCLCCFRSTLSLNGNDDPPGVPPTRGVNPSMPPSSSSCRRVVVVLVVHFLQAGVRR